MKTARLRVSLLLLSPFVFLLCQVAIAGQSTTPEPVKSSRAKAVKKKHKGILGLVPTYDITSSENTTPLTPRQKFRLALDDSVNPFEVAEAAVKAEYYRGTSPQKKIGRGGIGYLKQWGASYLDEVSGNMFHTFLYPTLLYQDPRYYRKGEGSIAGRVAYSLSRVFVTRSDTGRNEFNGSMLLGSATSTVLSTAYYPPRVHSVGITIGNIGWSLLGNGVGNVFKEFWPDIARKLHNK